jgi:NAD(P)-dependent dehydrogenase (short-subunit alcohol dehydrogenase family)/uncharacterized membrane protein
VRLRLVALALIGFCSAGYLSLFQLGVTSSVWDPLFGDGSRRVLESQVSRTFPIPDALLGCLAYGAEIVLGLIGDGNRWRTLPAAVITFGVVSASLATTAVVLLIAQPALVGTWCSLCVLSALTSLLIFVPAMREARAALRYVGSQRASGLGLSGILLGRAGSPANAAREPGPMPLREPGYSTNSETIPPTERKDDHVTRNDRQSAIREAGPYMPAQSDQIAETIRSRAGSGMVAGLGRALVHNATAALRDALTLPDEETRIDGKSVVVITGASAGVGRATAQAFARRGAAIGLIARGEAGLQAAKTEVESLGGRALAIRADVSDYEVMDRAASTIEDLYGPIDVWVNVAMASVFSPFAEMEMADFRRVTEVTYLGYVWGTRVALDRMRPRNRGHIIQVGSALAYRGIPLQSAYCGAKHAIQGFTESVRTELIHDRSNVWITMVQLPAVNTPQFNWVKSTLPNRAQPVPPIFQPEVPADAVLWAAEHHRRELNVGLSTDEAVYADKLAPGVLDHYLGDTGFSSQQTDEPECPDRPNNLYDPVDADHDAGAHGRFDRRASASSGQLWLAVHRNPVVLGLGGAATAFGILTFFGLRRRGSAAR